MNCSHGLELRDRKRRNGRTRRVLLTGWEKLGDDIWPMLRGPFAAAIWDPRSRSLTLARDHLGLNVVMWHKGENFFAFASMPNGLFALDEVPRELCEEKLADFLVLNHADHVTTMYRNVFRVPPAHVIRVKSDGSINQNATGRRLTSHRSNSLPTSLCGRTARMSRSSGASPNA